MELLCNLLGIISWEKNNFFYFLRFYLMHMKHFLGSLNSGLRKTVYVEMILENVKAASAI